MALVTIAQGTQVQEIRSVAQYLVDLAPLALAAQEGSSFSIQFPLKF